MTPHVVRNVAYVTSIVIVLAVSCEAGKRPPLKSLIINDAEPADVSVVERGLVTEKPGYRSILSDHGRFWESTSHRRFSGNVLAYVTPWNSKGYEVAKTFRAKFTHISPVWYQLRRDAESLKLQGGHDVDSQWIHAVRQHGYPKILPRVVLEGWAMEEMLTFDSERRHAINTLVSECKKQGFDGLVLEAWSAWTGAGILERPDLREKALDFVRQLATALHETYVSAEAAGLPPGTERAMELIFVIPPPSGRESLADFRGVDMALLEPDVDGFSLMTYDFSNANRPGPNAPLPWIRWCLQVLIPSAKPDFTSGHKWGLDEEDEEPFDHSHGRELKSFAVQSQGANALAAKVMMGLNFYGNDFSLPSGGGPILGGQILDLLDKHRPRLVFDEESAEHYFNYKVGGQQHRVFYPTLYSIARRLQEAEAWSAGISIWEVGQGLDYFYDLL